jgi:hypothetical protein
MNRMDGSPATLVATSWPSIWAAVAATGSFITAVMLWRVQRTNLWESYRPEIVLADWSREQFENSDALIFGRVENVGRGAAFAVTLLCRYSLDSMTALMTTRHFNLIRHGGEQPVDGRIVLSWNAVKEGRDMIAVPLEISFMDSLGYHYTTFQRLTVSREGLLFGAEDIAPGVVCSQRWTQAQSIFELRIKYALKKLRLSPSAWLKGSDPMKRRRVARYCHLVALGFEAVGSLFIFLEARRIIAQLHVAGFAGYGGEAPAGYRNWLHDSGVLGFGLLLTGIILTGVVLSFESRSEP